jgi:hypothetical protein
MSVGTFLAYNLNDEDVAEAAASKDAKSDVDGRTDFTQVKSDADVAAEQQRVTDLIEQQSSGGGLGRRKFFSMPLTQEELALSKISSQMRVEEAARNADATAAAVAADADPGGAARVAPPTKSGLFGKRRKARRGSIDSVDAPPASAMEGPLLKKSKRGAWQQRYFTTKSHYFIYAKAKGGESMGAVDIVGPQSTIALVGAELVVTGLDGDMHSFKKGETRMLRTFVLDSTSGGTANTPTLDEWARELLAMQRAMRQ